MKDKVFFQFVAVVALIVTVIFLFTDTRNDRMYLSGAVFLAASAISVFLGRKAGGGEDA